MPSSRDIPPLKPSQARPGQYQHCDDQAPETKLFAMFQGKFWRGKLSAEPTAHQQLVIEGVYSEAHPFRRYDRTACDAGNRNFAAALTM
jgi:hypothetical protein